MKKIVYESPQQMRDEIKEYKGVSGIYIISFEEDSENNYVGQTKDLYVRLRQHIGNMDLKNKGISSPSHITEKEWFEEFGTYTITIYEAPEINLHWYEEFCNWYFGSFSRSRYTRVSRSVLVEKVCPDFEWITPQLLEKFDMPIITPAPVKKSSRFDEPEIPQWVVNGLLRAKERNEKEKDFGF